MGMAGRDTGRIVEVQAGTQVGCSGTGKDTRSDKGRKVVVQAGTHAG